MGTAPSLPPVKMRSGSSRLVPSRLLLAARDGDHLTLPPHCWDGVQDETLPVLALAEKGQCVRVAHPARVMSNSFGFGGNNCTLVLGEPS